MVFWTISLGYGAAVLFYRIGTFALHPHSSAGWIVGVVAYFVVLGAASFYVGPRPRNIPSTPTNRRPARAVVADQGWKRRSAAGQGRETPREEREEQRDGS